MTLNKVKRYLFWRKLRDEISVETTDINKRRMREKYSFNASMNKPSDSELADYNWEILQGENK